MLTLKTKGKQLFHILDKETTCEESDRPKKTYVWKLQLVRKSNRILAGEVN